MKREEVDRGRLRTKKAGGGGDGLESSQLVTMEWNGTVGRLVPPLSKVASTEGKARKAGIARRVSDADI